MKDITIIAAVGVLAIVLSRVPAVVFEALTAPVTMEEFKQTWTQGPS